MKLRPSQFDRFHKFRILHAIPMLALLLKCIASKSCFKNVGVVSEVDLLVIQCGSCYPSLVSFLPTNTGEAGGVFTVYLTVLHIADLRSVVKISPSVIVSYLIFMVNSVLWKVPIHKKKSEAVGEVFSPVNSDLDVTNGVDTPSKVTNMSRACTNQPSKDASSRGIVKEFFEMRLGQHGNLSA